MTRLAVRIAVRVAGGVVLFLLFAFAAMAAGQHP